MSDEVIPTPAPEPPVNMLEVKIDEARAVFGFRYADGGFGLCFKNGEQETPLRISPEAADATISLLMHMRQVAA